MALDMSAAPLIEAPAEVLGRVHSWDTSVGVDGPGTRFVVFTAGCPLRCVYCHNPDTWAGRSGTVMAASELLTELDCYAPFLRVAGGGVTVSGGEPLLQPAFTAAVLAGAKDRGLHTALDTSGFLGNRATDELLEATDLVLLDIKSFDAQTYRRVTGVSVMPTLLFAQRLADLGKPVVVRFVLVPGWTDDPANVAPLAGFVAGLGNVERVDVLGFHRLGDAKYAALGLPDRTEGARPPTVEQLAVTREIFRAEGVPVS